MAAKSNQVKKAEKYAKDKKLGIKNYTLPTLAKTRQDPPGYRQPVRATQVR